MKDRVELEILSNDAWAETGRRSDDYYRKLSAWLVKGRCKETAADCRELAYEYDRTLDAYINYARELTDSASCEFRMRLAVTYKSILSRDLEYLGTALASESE